MTTNPRDQAFYKALKSMDRPYVPWGLRYSILQQDIPEGFFIRDGHGSFMRDFWETLSYAEPSSALEMRLLEKLSLPFLGADSTWLSVSGPNSWPAFWTNVLTASHKNGGIYTLAKQRLQTVTAGTASLLSAARDLTKKTDEEALAAQLRSKAIKAADNWADWRAVASMKAGANARVRAQALEKLRTLPAERSQLEPNLISQDPEIQLIAVDRLLETFPDRCDLWRRRYLLVRSQADRYRCWIKFLSLTPSASELALVLFHVWEDQTRRPQCLEAMDHLGADCAAWIGVQLHPSGTRHNDPKLLAVREVIWQRVLATAHTCTDWYHVTRGARHRKDAALAGQAFAKSLELAKTFEELSNVYDLCLHDVPNACGTHKEHNPEHAQTIETLLARMRATGTFEDYRRNFRLLKSDRLPNLVRLAVTVPQMGEVYGNYFDVPYKRAEYAGLYTELLRRMHAAGPALVSSFLPKKKRSQPTA